MSAGPEHPPDWDHGQAAWTAWVAGEMAAVVAELDALMAAIVAELDARAVERERDEARPSRP